jgi:hypothetical protein
MSSLETLSLLCPSICSYSSASSQSTSADRLTRPELSAVLSGLMRHEVSYALAKYCLDDDSLSSVVSHVQVVAGSYAVKGQWEIVRGRPLVYTMSKLAVYEFVSPCRCVKCNGRGAIVNKVCKSCQGSGYVKLSGRRLAESMGVTQAQWVRQWKSRYGEIINYVQDIDSKVNFCISRVNISG